MINAVATDHGIPVYAPSINRRAATLGTSVNTQEKGNPISDKQGKTKSNIYGMVFIMYWLTVSQPALIIIPHMVKMPDVSIADKNSRNQFTPPYLLKPVMAKAASTDTRASDMTFESTYSVVRKGETIRTDNTPCVFSSMIITPMKNNPSTEGSEKTTRGNAIDNTSFGKNESMIK